MPRSQPPSPPVAAEPIRLNKALAQAGVCSRRAADELIRSGKVTVNGQPADLGTPVRPGVDEVRVEGRPVAFAPGEEHLYFMLNKPVEVVTTAKDPEGRRTVIELMGSTAGGRRLFPVGRLDYFSEGLLLLTTDGELANRLMHPRWHQPKLYHVTVRGEAPAQALEAMRSGMRLAEGERLAPVKVRLLEGAQPGRSILEMELIQGINRQIRRMCRDLNLTILRLVRVAQGPVKLGDLASGMHRALTGPEVAALKASVGL